MAVELKYHQSFSRTNDFPFERWKVTLGVVISKFVPNQSPEKQDMLQSIWMTITDGTTGRRLAILRVNTFEKL